MKDTGGDRRREIAEASCGLRSALGEIKSSSVSTTDDPKRGPPKVRGRCNVVEHGHFNKEKDASVFGGVFTAFELSTRIE